jgi:hypothetical protein
VVDAGFTTGGGALRSGKINFPGTGSGDLLLITVGMHATAGPSPTIVSITDSRGETWLRAVANNPTTSTYSAELWYVPNAVAGVTSAVITVSGDAYWQGHYQEVTGVSATRTVLDRVSSGASTTASSVSSGPITTTAAREFVVATTVWDGATGLLYPSNGGWNSDPTQTYVPAELHAYQTASSPGRFSFDGRMTPAASWVVLIASFKAG